ncbi:methyltransferase domain-containing protein [Actinomadura sp. NPDC048032]|uniref:methyltransferase domain-containing protein n=1 Tax=Actinomadura sp. NPDC048032 TaxID=3155747 RepID=UPI0033ECF08E
MTVPSDAWRTRARALADLLSDQGEITDPVWHRTVARVPRHVFVPAFYSDDDPPELVDATDPRWLRLAYSNDTLVTQRKEHPDHPGMLWSTSSSTRPSLMLRMLQILDVADGMTVLEIGTGTGYNAALLSERLGSSQVVSVDIDPDLISVARNRLADAGYHPSLMAGDGSRGCPARAPYDRLIATVATERVPYAWVEQTRPGGIILADVRPRGMTWAGALARLTVADDGTATGPLISCTWGFMSARRDVALPGVPEGVPIDTSTTHTRTSDVGREALRTPGLSLLIWQRLPGLNAFPGASATRVTTPDGSWANVTGGTPAKVEHGGPSDIWRHVEDAHAWWSTHDRPDVEAFGLTLGHDQYRLWFQTPEGERWPAPGEP